MNLLIVEDNATLAEITAELLRSLDRRTEQLEAITIAHDLETAMCLLPQQDAVLCDGMFPISPESREIAEEWDVVRKEAERRGVHFVLYSGSESALDRARDRHSRTHEAHRH